MLKLEELGHLIDDLAVQLLMRQPESPVRALQQAGAPKTVATPSSIAQDPELMADFILESGEHLASIETQLLMLERDPCNAEALNAVFRGFHTIKGLAGFLELRNVQKVAHETETVLDRARNGERTLTPPAIDAILASADYLRRFLSHLEAPGLRGRPAVDVWSAACSTGEEIWTLAMVLNDAMPAARLQLVGTDISNRALETAAEGRYSAERCATLPARWLARYLAPEGHPAASYRVAPELRRQASFRRLNLTQPYDWPRLFPVVFCRKVMIYFDGPVQELVVRRLTGFLEPGGYLFVGHAESLTGSDHGLEYLRPAIYRKPARREGRWTRSLWGSPAAGSPLRRNRCWRRLRWVPASG